MTETTPQATSDATTAW